MATVRSISRSRTRAVAYRPPRVCENLREMEETSQTQVLNLENRLTHVLPRMFPFRVPLKHDLSVVYTAAYTTWHASRMAATTMHCIIDTYTYSYGMFVKKNTKKWMELRKRKT